MNNFFEQQYLMLLRHVLRTGEERPSRAGPTISCFGTTLRIPGLSEGLFPIVTTRKMHYKPVLGELAAFLRGAEDLATFKKFGCNHWDANAAAWEPNADPFLKEDPQVGRIYGAQWREWQGRDQYIDQLAELVRGLKQNPYGRRHLLTAYNPAELDDACLPPCHLLAQFNVNTKSRLDCIVYMRSVDLCLGLPSDIILYATLMILVAQETGYALGDLTFMMGDTHIYKNHCEGVEKQLKVRSFALPTWSLDEEATLDTFTPAHLGLLNYVHAETIKYEFNV